MSERIMVTQAGMDGLINRLRDAIRQYSHLLDALDQDVSTLRDKWTGEASDAYDRAHRDWTAKLARLNELLAEHLYEEVVAFAIDAIPLGSQFIQANPIKWLEMAEPIAECIARVLEAVQAVVALIFEFGMQSNSDLEGFRASASNTVGTDFGRWPVARLS